MSAGSRLVLERTLKQPKVLANFGFAALLLMLSACANHSIPIVNIHDHPLPAQVQNLPLDEISRRISAAATRLGWQVAQESPSSPGGPSQLRAIYAKEDHIVTVHITYSRTSFSIDFVSSINMDEEGGKIHHKYAAWLAALDAAISQGIGRPS
jgi:hypothetical protein